MGEEAASGGGGAGPVKRGFLLGKFMPPHAGHMLLCNSASELVDELTILVCWQEQDPIPGPLRLAWMEELLPRCRMLGFCDPAPQQPADDPNFWETWRAIVRSAHPEPIDLLFAGESYGIRLAAEVGAHFVPLGGRCLGADAEGLGGVSATAVRGDPWGSWRWLPQPVRSYYAQRISLHGPESVGKSMLAERLASHYGTVWVPEYGRAYCEAHGTDLGEDALLHIADVQQSTANGAARWCDRRLFLDTDPLMTAAWCEMMIGRIPDALLERPKADLYLMLEPDLAWVDDGTRLYGDAESRDRFARICRHVLETAGVRWEPVEGTAQDRFDGAVAAVERLAPPGKLHGLCTASAFDTGPALG